MNAPASSLIDQRLLALRGLMAERRLQALLVPRADEFLGEYIPEHNERLRWVSGFTGSAGMVVVLMDRAAIFVDGRYTVQVREQAPAAAYEYHHLVEEPVGQWLCQQLQPGMQVGCDPRLHNRESLLALEDTLAAARITLSASADNLVDACWHDRPAAAVAPALLLAEQYTGESSAAKRQRIGQDIAAAGADAAWIFAPDSVSWLLNLRGEDVPRLPVVQAHALLWSNGRLQVLLDPGRVPPGLDQHVGAGVEALPLSQAEAVFQQCAGKRVMADPVTANAWSVAALAAAGATIVDADDPVIMPKACKNAEEIAGAQAAHQRDAVAVIQFLAWLEEEVAGQRWHSEADLADALYRLREAQAHYQQPSFDTISAAGGNAAMPHYNHLNGEPATVQAGSLYLVDSGGQYIDGTTDITRTVAIGEPTAEHRRLFTLVLKGHIALDRVRFPKGTTGSQLDILARQFLWQSGFDYDHGTGHGVGAFLSVHEGPQRIAKAGNRFDLRPGMILSNEPGYYRSGEFGMRCENLVYVAEQDPGGDQKMMGFHALTLVPFDRSLIDAGLLTDDELQWVNAYHHKVAGTIGPLLPEPVQAWLLQATQPIVA